MKLLGAFAMRIREFIISPSFEAGYCPAVLALSGFWAFLAFASFRWLPALIWLTAIFIYCTRRFHRCLKAVVVAWLLFLAASFSPADITFRGRPGVPKFVPLRMGLIIGLSEEEARGDVVLGGCMVTGYEPRWVLLW
jgi:hypothetical protein